MMSLTIKCYNNASHFEFEQDFDEVLSLLDIYYLPSFLAADAFMQGGQYELFTVKTRQGVWIYPYILVPIAETEWYDLCSPYGYAGPYCNDSDLFDNAEQAFLTYIQNQNIVTEFVRYHYLYNATDSRRFRHNITNLENRTIVLLNCTKGTESIWEKSFSSTNRNLVRKLRKGDYRWHWRAFRTEDIAFFSDMYNDTMKHAQAAKFYYFDHAFYQLLIQLLGEKLKIAIVEKDGFIFSAALFFQNSNIITYYLSARNLDFPKITSSNFLLSEVSLWAAEHGFKWLNFGGGLTSDEKDRLYQFKRNFSTETSQFYIGKRIHNIEKYQQLIDRYIEEYGEEQFANVKHILQFYRS